MHAPTTAFLRSAEPRCCLLHVGRSSNRPGPLPMRECLVPHSKYSRRRRALEAVCSAATVSLDLQGTDRETRFVLITGPKQIFALITGPHQSYHYGSSQLMRCEAHVVLWRGSLLRHVSPSSCICFRLCRRQVSCVSGRRRGSHRNPNSTETLIGCGERRDGRGCRAGLQLAGPLVCFGNPNRIQGGCPKSREASWRRHRGVERRGGAVVCGQR